MAKVSVKCDSHPTGWLPNIYYKLFLNKELVGAARFELGTSGSRIDSCQSAVVYA